MRKVILLVLSSAMLIGGLFAAVSQLVLGHFTVFGVFRLIGGGALLAFFGGYLIWTDFIAPRLGVKTWEDE